MGFPAGRVKRPALHIKFALMVSTVVQITIDAIEDMAPSHKRRFATVAIPREQLMAALGSFANSKRTAIINAGGLIFLLLQLAPAHAVTTAPVEVTCPLTGEVFTTRVFRSFTVRGYRLDSRPVLAGSPQILPLPVTGLCFMIDRVFGGLS